MHRACDEYDLTLRDHIPGRPHRDYVRFHSRVEVGLSLARGYLGSTGELYGTSEGFAGAVCEAHRLAFGQVHPGWAGRFRREGERVYVGHNHHEFEGFDPLRIGSEIERLWPTPAARKRFSAGSSRGARQRFATWAALFLQRFLAVHPFIDGNGRICRLLVEVIAERSGFFVVQSIGKPSKDRRDYLYALQYAHKYCGVSPASTLLGVSPRRDPHCFLARWWEKRIDERPLDAELESPPDWLDDVDDEPGGSGD